MIFVLVKLSCDGVLLDFRREGVKNNRRLLCFIGVSLTFPVDGRDVVGLGDSSTTGVANPLLSIRVRSAPTIDRGVLSVLKAVTDAASEGDVSYDEESIFVCCCKGYDCMVGASGSPIARFR